MSDSEKTVQDGEMGPSGDRSQIGPSGIRSGRAIFCRDTEQAGQILDSLTVILRRFMTRPG